MTERTRRPEGLRQSLLQREHGNDALARGDREAARQCLEAAVRLNPWDDDSALLASMLHLEDGDTGRAAELVAEAIRIRPFHPSAFNFLGRVCNESGRPQLAEKLISRAIALAPGFTAARRNLKIVKRQARNAAKRGGASAGDHGDLWKSLRQLLETGAPRLSLSVLVLPGQEAELQATLDSVRVPLHETVVLGVGTNLQAMGYQSEGSLCFHRLSATNETVAVRNEALALCRGDWILMLDPGERLDADAARWLDEAMNSNRNLGWALPVGTAATPGQFRLRLIRNAPGLRFRGRLRADLRGAVHEALESWGLSYDTLSLPVGSETNEPTLSPEERRLEKVWLDELLRRNENDWSLHEALSRLALEENDLDVALDHVRDAQQRLHGSATGRHPLFLEPLVVLEGQILARRREFTELAERMRRHRDHHSPCAGTSFLEGLACQSTGESDRAVDCLVRARQLASEPGFTPLPEAARGSGMLHLLSSAQLDTRRLEDAEETLREAARRDSRDLKTQLGLAGLLLAQGRRNDGLASLDRIAEFHGDDPDAWSLAGQILLLHADLTAVAVEWYREAARRHPDDPGVNRGFGEALIRSGCGAESLECWRDLDDRDGRDAAARVAAALISDRDVPDVPADQMAEVTRALLDLYQQWATAGVYEALDSALTAMTRAEPLLPGLTHATATWLDECGQTEAAQNLRQGLAGDEDGR